MVGGFVGTIGFKAAVKISLRRLRRTWMQMGFINGFDRVPGPGAIHPVSSRLEWGMWPSQHGMNSDGGGISSDVVNGQNGGCGRANTDSHPM